MKKVHVLNPEQLAIASAIRFNEKKPYLINADNLRLIYYRFSKYFISHSHTKDEFCLTERWKFWLIVLFISWGRFLVHLKIKLSLDHLRLLSQWDIEGKCNFPDRREGRELLKVIQMWSFKYFVRNQELETV